MEGKKPHHLSLLKAGRKNEEGSFVGTARKKSIAVRLRLRKGKIPGQKNGK